MSKLTEKESRIFATRIWEHLNNPAFNVTEFSNIVYECGSNGYVLFEKLVTGDWAGYPSLISGCK